MINISKHLINGRVDIGTHKLMGKAILSNNVEYGSNTGDGILTDYNAIFKAPTEIWTLTCIDTTTAGSEVFSVEGSVSGSKDNATVGVAYDNQIVSFTINEGNTNFAVGDKIILSIIRDVKEYEINSLVSTIQIELNGDSSVCNIEFKASINDNFFITDAIILTTEDITNKGKILGVSDIFYNKCKVVFKNIDVINNSEVIVYGA